jgi:hypothetical protein
MSMTYEEICTGSKIRSYKPSLNQPKESQNAPKCYKKIHIKNCESYYEAKRGVPMSQWEIGGDELSRSIIVYTDGDYKIALLSG